MFTNPLQGKSLVYLFFQLLLFLKDKRHAPFTTSIILDEYDYVVVGAGSGGSTVAARLSEKSCVSVLLLEAGPSPPKVTDIPILSRFFFGLNIDWGYFTVPQKHTGAGLIDRQVYFPAGKVIGGSSIWNAMLYVRGAHEVYDKWAAGGATGWSYRDVLPYFKKSERNSNPESVEKEYHGFDGPMNIEKPDFENEYRSGIEAAAYELKSKPIDINGRFSKGFYDYQTNNINGTRCSVAKAYLVPADSRTNLHIVKGAFVTKVIIKNRKAVGVQFDHYGIPHVVRAKREVILSAGTINTAKLLMLSGIGPKEHLAGMNITLVADLPVGMNLQDHPGCIQNYYTDQMPPVILKLLDPLSILKYAIHGKGMWASAESIQFVSFGTNDPNTPPDAIPDFELFFIDGLTLLTRYQANIKPEIAQKVYGPYEFKSQLWCVSQLLHPKSHGTVKLRSSSPYDSPLIDPNYLADPRDLDDIVGGMKECDRIVNTNAMQRLGVKPFPEILPGCELYVNNKDDYYRCIVKTVVVTLSHQSGTAKMGQPSDPSTVVDPELKVKGIKGLRVVDASVMPTVTGGNTNNPTIMIGEKAADMIKSGIQCPR